MIGVANFETGITNNIIVDHVACVTIVPYLFHFVFLVFCNPECTKISCVNSIAATRNPSKEVSKPKSLAPLSSVFKSLNEVQIRYAKETFFNVSKYNKNEFRNGLNAQNTLNIILYEDSKHFAQIPLV